MIDPEPENWWTESQDVLRLVDHVHLDQPGKDLVAIPIRLLDSATLGRSYHSDCGILSDRTMR